MGDSTASTSDFSISSSRPLIARCARHRCAVGIRRATLSGAPQIRLGGAQLGRELGTHRGDLGDDRRQRVDSTFETGVSEALAEADHRSPPLASRPCELHTPPVGPSPEPRRRSPQTAADLFVLQKCEEPDAELHDGLRTARGLR